MFEREQLAAHAAHMAEFARSHAYDVLKTHLEAYAEDQVTRLVTGTSLDLPETRRLQGVLQGLKYAVDLPARIQEFAKQQGR